MANGKSDLTVFIGRFSPFHNGHATVLRRALQKSKVVLVLLGSADQPRTIKNPFTADERTTMIDMWYGNESWKNSKPNLNGGRLEVAAIHDTPYNDQLWIRDVQVAVEACKNKYVDLLGLNPTIAITGAKRDATSWYLEAFPTWEKDFVSADESDFNLSATDVRRILFNSQNCHIDDSCAIELARHVPETTRLFLDGFAETDEAQQLRREFQFINKYKMAWEAAPYAPTFVTVDNVVVQSGHVLLIRRRSEPGKGLWALPGGFVNQTERLLDAAIRELREETKLKVPAAVLKGSVKSKEIFDHPDRSLRGRTLTIAYLIALPDQEQLPEVKGSDDAEKAEWVPIAKIQSMRDQLFEDHYSIIETMLGRLQS